MNAAKSPTLDRLRLIESDLFSVVLSVIDPEDEDEIEAFLMLLTGGESIPVSRSLAFDILRLSLATMLVVNVSGLDVDDLFRLWFIILLINPCLLVLECKNEISF